MGGRVKTLGSYLGGGYQMFGPLLVGFISCSHISLSFMQTMVYLSKNESLCGIFLISSFLYSPYLGITYLIIVCLQVNVYKIRYAHQSACMLICVWMNSCASRGCVVKMQAPRGIKYHLHTSLGYFRPSIPYLMNVP